MVEINLLTWRAQKNQYEKKSLCLLIIAGAIVAGTLWGGLHYFVMKSVDAKMQRVSMLSARLPDVPRESADIVTENDERKYMNASSAIKIIDAAATTIQLGVCYQRILREGAHVSLAGRAWSAVAVTLALQELEQNEVLGAANLGEMKRESENKLMHFSIEAGVG